MNGKTLIISIISILALSAIFSSCKIYETNNGNENNYEADGFMKGFDASSVSLFEEKAKMPTALPKIFSNF